MTGVVATLLVVVILLIGRGAFAAWARWMSVRQTNAGAISEAQRWLTWSTWLDAGSGETELMQAACFRRLGQMSRWEKALTAAEEKEANPERIRQERMLGLIRQGVYELPANHGRNAIGSGLPSHELAAVSIRGHLARKEPEKARKILESWAADAPHEAYLAYMWGVYWYVQGDESRALTAFETTLAKQPKQELAWSALAKLLEKQSRLGEALEEYVHFLTHCPNDTAKVGLARVLRKLGRLAAARALVEPLALSSDRLPEAWDEMGSIELEKGNYPKAQRWFAKALVVDGPKQWEWLSDAATGLALQGEVVTARQIFTQVIFQEGVIARSTDLDARFAVGTNKQDAAEEFQRLSAAAIAAAAKGRLIQNKHTDTTDRENAGRTPADLYAFYCRACHGPNGDGNGRAARHLFPKPRDFRSGQFRLVSTLNGNPTLEDIETVIQRGMPGTSMRSFENLSENQRQLLAQEILRLRREGIRERYVSILEKEEAEIHEEDIQEIVELRSVPGEIVHVPSIGSVTPQSLARGKNVYFEWGCRSCHGDDGTGAFDVALFDENGQPASPRDLVNDPFKGGHEPESIGRRILIGMPGSPHPATRGLTQQQSVDLIQYCRLLTREPKQPLTNHQRFLKATSRPAASSLNE